MIKKLNMRIIVSSPAEGSWFSAGLTVSISIPINAAATKKTKTCVSPLAANKPGLYPSRTPDRYYPDRGCLHAFYIGAGQK